MQLVKRITSITLHAGWCFGYFYLCADVVNKSAASRMHRAQQAVACCVLRVCVWELFSIYFRVHWAAGAQFVNVKDAVSNMHIYYGRAPFELDIIAVSYAARAMGKFMAFRWSTFRPMFRTFLTWTRICSLCVSSPAIFVASFNFLRGGEFISSPECHNHPRRYLLPINIFGRRRIAVKLPTTDTVEGRSAPISPQNIKLAWLIKMLTIKMRSLDKRERGPWSISLRLVIGFVVWWLLWISACRIFFCKWWKLMLF